MVELSDIDKFSNYTQDSRETILSLIKFAFCSPVPIDTYFKLGNLGNKFLIVIKIF